MDKCETPISVGFMQWQCSNGAVGLVYILPQPSVHKGSNGESVKRDGDEILWAALQQVMEDEYGYGVHSDCTEIAQSRTSGIFLRDMVYSIDVPYNANSCLDLLHAFKIHGFLSYSDPLLPPATNNV